MKTRADHLDWAKKRGLELLDDGENAHAVWASMMSDLNKHPELENHPALELGMMLVFSGGLDDKEDMKKFIKDFR